MINSKTLVWLDDCRDPFARGATWIQEYSPIVNPMTVVWLTSYKAFTNWVETNGLPGAICFDHDLGEEGDNEKTGFDCAKWLVNYCINNNLILPLYGIQSSNPVGKENIDSYLKNFIKMQENA